MGKMNINKKQADNDRYNYALKILEKKCVEEKGSCESYCYMVEASKEVCGLLNGMKTLTDAQYDSLKFGYYEFYETCSCQSFDKGGELDKSVSRAVENVLDAIEKLDSRTREKTSWDACTGNAFSDL